MPQVNFLPAGFDLNINSPNFLGGNNVHNVLILLMLALLLMKRR